MRTGRVSPCLTKAIQEHLTRKARVIVERGKGKPDNWSEDPFDRKPDFQEGFDHIVSNEEVAEAENEYHQIYMITLTSICS